MAEKEIEIKLKATGGQSAAKEVETVEKAVEDLAASAAEATGPQSDPASLVPAWDEVGGAVAGAGEKMDGTAGSAESLDDVLGEMRQRIGGARGSLDQLKAAAEAAGGSAGGGGIKGLGTKLLGLAGGPIGLAITALTAAIAWLSKFDERMRKSRAAVAELADETRELSDSIAEIDAAPVNDLAEAVERHREALAGIEERMDVHLRAIDRNREEAERAMEAELAWRDAVIDRQSAQGKMSKEEAARQKGGNALEALERTATADLEAATEKMKVADAEVRRVWAELTAAKWDLRNVGAPPTEARDSAAQQRTRAVELQRELDRLTRELEEGTSKPVELGGISLRRAMAMQRQIAELEAEAEVEKERGKELAAQAKEEKAAHLELVAAKRKQVEATEQALENMREEQRAAAAEWRTADQRRKLADTYGRATIEERTGAELARIAAENQERERRAQEKADRERERQEREEAKRRRDEEMAALQAEIKAAAPGLSDRAGRGEAAGFKEGAKALESAAQGFADGAGLGELERVLYNTARVIEGAPARQQEQLRLLLAPLEKAVSVWQRRMETIEQQIRNNPNRG